jgi:hypothetical protein
LVTDRDGGISAGLISGADRPSLLNYIPVPLSPTSVQVRDHHIAADYHLK